MRELRWKAGLAAGAGAACALMTGLLAIRRACQVFGGDGGAQLFDGLAMVALAVVAGLAARQLFRERG